MSNTNGVAYRDKSMNGVITISDGGGTTISNGTITANTLKINELTTNTIKSTSPSSTVNAYIANTGNVNIGGATSTLKLSNTIEPFSTVSPVNLFPSASNIVVGNETDIVKVSKYEFIGDDIVGMTNSDTTRLFNNLTTGELNIAPSLTTGTCTIGSATSTNTVGRFIFDDFFINFDDPTGYVACFDDIECYFGDYATYTGLGTHSDRIDVGHFQNEEQEVRIGNYRNINNVGKYILIGDDIFSDAVDTATTMMSNITTGSLTIATGLTTGALTLGNATNTNTVGKFNLIGDTITSATVSSAITMFNNQTSGSINIGTNGGSSILMGNFANTNRMGNFTYIGNNITSSGSNILNLYNNQTHGNGCSMLTGFTTASVNIATGLTTGFINLGSTAMSALSGGVRIYKPLFTGYTTLTTPTSNQLGFVLVGTGANNNSPPLSVVATLRTLTLTVGVWLLQGNAQFGTFGNSPTVWANLGISATAGLDTTSQHSVACNINAVPVLQVNRIVTLLTGTQVYNLLVQTNIATVCSSINFQALRIA